MTQIKFYLWYSEEKGLFFITDYDERKNGLVKIDGQGYIKVTLLHISHTKTDLITFAQRFYPNESKS